MKKKTFDVYVAVGSSAGGFEALSSLVKYLPKKTGFYYIVAQHHALGEKSILAELLNRNSKIEVILVELGMVFKPDILYILPPELQIVIKKNRPVAVGADLNLRVALPNADLLFSELSTLKNSKTIAILLSGSGHDGTGGMKAVKESDGITIVQSPEETMFESMPRHAIDARLVDYILEVKDISIKLVKLANAFANGTYLTEELPFDEIVKILHKEKQLDLSKYKEETINRRIQKRIDILKLAGIEEYAQYFKENIQEINILNQEVLIGVTEFFRGLEAFEMLRENIKQKLLIKPEYSEFRVWSVACSSGEEAYSIAILVNEVMQEIDKKFYVKIFASDIDDIALEKARIGEYGQKALDTLKSDLLEKYFVKSANGYRVVKTLRDQLVFAHHNFLNNPAFISMDLISCRNVLIYLKSTVQRDVFSIFHYALNNNGILFLGSSESTLSSLELFSTLDSKYRIYEKKYETKQLSFPNQVVNKYIGKTFNSRKYTMQKPIKPIDIEKYLHESLFEYFSNGSLVIDSDYNIVYKKGKIVYLNFSDGLLSLNLFENLDKALHYEVKKLLRSVSISNMKEISKFIQLGSSKVGKFVQIIVQPFHMPEYKSMILISFLEIESKELFLNCTNLPSFNENKVISTLSLEITQARAEIEDISDELMFSKQNMAMMNAELQDSNEKLQSTVEELETSNEELQSSNEELQVSLTSNRELQNKLSLILESSMDGVIGLDIHARHTFVNEKAAKMLGYSAEYLIGKDSHKLWHHTKADGSHYPESECPIVEVLRDGKSGRGEDLFWKKNGTSFPVELVRSPIMEDGKIIGAVIGFHDITHRRALEKKVKHEHEMMETYLRVSGIMIVFIDLNGIIIDINDAGVKTLGLGKKEIIGLNWFEKFVLNDVRQSVQELFSSIVSGKEKSVSHNINKIIDAQKKEHLISWRNSVYKNENGEIIGVMATGSDITKEDFLTEELAQSNIKYEQTFENAQIGISHVGLDGFWLDVNSYLCNLLGYEKKELLQLSIEDITHPDDLEIDLGYLNQLLEGEMNHYNMEKRYLNKNGNIIWANLSVILLRDNLNQPLYFIAIIQDISEIKTLMLELEVQKNKFETIVRLTPNPLMTFSEDGKILMINKTFSEMTGYRLSEIPTIKKWLSLTNYNRDILDSTNINALFDNNISIDCGQISVTTKKGEKLIWMSSLAPLLHIHNTKRVMIFSAMDITKMYENEELMLAQSRQAAMGDMIGMIAHQWRQPLSVISMVGNNLQADLDLNLSIEKTQLYELAATLNEQTQSLSHIIDDFRTFLKPQKEKEKVSLCSVYEKLKNMMEKTLSNNDINLEFRNDCHVDIYTFSNEFIQVFINLLNNAKDSYKEQNIQNATIKITTLLEADELKIEVQDNAGGIDKDIIDKLGEPYVSTKSKNGTGLGIYMSKMILEKHFNGKLSWKNSDEGACFTITLPLNE